MDMARRTFNAMISLPIDLAPLWDSLGNKSAFVVDHLRALGGAEVVHKHWHYPAGAWDRRVLGMCNPNVAVCPVCIQQFEFGTSQALSEWNRRIAIIDEEKYIIDGFGSKPVSARNYIIQKGTFDPMWFEFEWSPVDDAQLGDEDE